MTAIQGKKKPTMNERKRREKNDKKHPLKKGET